MSGERSRDPIERKAICQTAARLSQLVDLNSSINRMAHVSRVIDPATFPTAFDHALNAGDLDGLLQLFEPGACMRRRDDSVALGTEQITSELRTLISANAQLHNRLRHIFLSGDTALIVVDWTIELNSPDGKRITTEGTATNVIRQSTEHGWRMLIANTQGVAA